MIEVQTWYRDLFWEWCQQNNILCEYMGTKNFGIGFDRKPYDSWYIGNEKHRMWAVLRWAQ